MLAIVPVAPGGKHRADDFGEVFVLSDTGSEILFGEVWAVERKRVVGRFLVNFVRFIQHEVVEANPVPGLGQIALAVDAAVLTDSGCCRSRSSSAEMRSSRSLKNGPAPSISMNSPSR